MRMPIAMIHLDVDGGDRRALHHGRQRRRPAVSPASSTSTRTCARSGRSAPCQRRGRKGLIGVSAMSDALIGMIGPWAERLYAVEPAGVATSTPSATSSGSRTSPSISRRKRAA